ncbi:peptide-N4-(N-acetyl-beta-glucosaminyl)asparagine amidase A [Argentina anserina]|uniref:peptide-N4-(N-acetyl-beta- glucosaminyl)asparagine amidase A n=1 Tax=Argentina anserina TaxID=57926 RepID=UPI0021768FD5|nr:peptide-N4-(N-acetyl-beta-glucosaminyl)asparagine amidase A [Potentilla anserina]
MYGLLFVLLFFTAAVSAASFPDRFTTSSSVLRHKSQEYFELNHPLPSDLLPPSCSRRVLTHSFANTINGPPYSAPYSPPPPSDSDCSAPWSHVALEFRATCKGEQYDRIAGIWLGGVELLRTSTAEPTEKGIFWKLRKDITKYSSLLTRSDLTLTMMLENVVDRVFTGVYHVDVLFLFYKQTVAVIEPRISPIIPDHKLGIAPEEPADLIVPISDDGDRGFWFRIESESDSPSRQIRLPRNTRRVVLELYVSFHGDDEFWYSNPPNLYISTNNLTTGRGNGAYREVFVTVDGELVGSEVPFPVVFTGGINPLFWEPVVAIGAFNLPSYEFELTPFLGKLLDKKAHSFGIGVSDAISYWLVNANLHIWLDHKAKTVHAKSSLLPSPAIQLKRNAEFKLLDGSFKIKAQRRTGFVGWVKSSSGNYTTMFSQKYKFSSSISFAQNGTYKLVQQNVKADKEVRVVGENGVEVLRTRSKRRYPIQVITATLPGRKKDTYVLVTNVTHSMKEKSLRGGYLSRVNNFQDSKGWMEVRDHSVLSGTADTQQSFGYRGDYGCYLRLIDAVDGSLIRDNSSFHCLSPA